MADALLMPLKVHPIRPGELRHQIVLLQPVPPAQGPFNDAPAAFSAAATVWAEVNDLTGSLVAAGGAVIAGHMRIRVRTRYYAGLVTGWRVTWNGLTFTVLTVSDPDNKRCQQYMLCEEVTP